MPRGTTPLPAQSGQPTPSWAAMARRMKALLLGSLLSRSASSFSTLKATTAVLGARRGMAGSGRRGHEGFFFQCKGVRLAEQAQPRRGPETARGRARAAQRGVGAAPERQTRETGPGMLPVAD